MKGYRKDVEALSSGKGKRERPRSGGRLEWKEMQGSWESTIERERGMENNNSEGQLLC